MTTYCVMDDEGITLTESLLEATHRVVLTDWRTPDGLGVYELRDLDGYTIRHIKLPIS
jgi:hypothetical protein